jgi:ABC-type multidrug transport system fused ATPase/permease subunit
LSYAAGIGGSITIGFRVYLFLSQNWVATRQLHSDMIGKVLEAPVNLYFDVTPVGRILNKFSKDLNQIE